MSGKLPVLTDDAVQSGWFCEPDEVQFDQPCVFGERVSNHAVYCTNHEWIDGPRKCRRTRYTGGETRDEDCEGFKPNLRVAISVPPAACSNCQGYGRISITGLHSRTCPECAGSGEA